MIAHLLPISLGLARQIGLIEGRRKAADDMAVDDGGGHGSAGRYGRPTAGSYGAGHDAGVEAGKKRDDPSAFLHRINQRSGNNFRSTSTRHGSVKIAQGGPMVPELHSGGVLLDGDFRSHFAEDDYA